MKTLLIIVVFLAITFSMFLLAIGLLGVVTGTDFHTIFITKDFCCIVSILSIYAGARVARMAMSWYDRFILREEADQYYSDMAEHLARERYPEDYAHLN